MENMWMVKLFAGFDSASGHVTFSWSGPGLKLQMTTNDLSEAVWYDVPAGHASPLSHEPATDVKAAFFRLVPVSE